MEQSINRVELLGRYLSARERRQVVCIDPGFVNGKRRRKVIYGKTRKEVADKLKALHRDQASGVHLAVERQTVETFLLRWLDDVVSQRNKARTQDSYRNTVRRHIVPTLGHYQLDQLRPEHVQMMIRALQAQELHRTAQYARTILVRALNQAVKWRLLSYNPAALTEPPHVEKHVIELLTIQQAHALLEAVQGDPRLTPLLCNLSDRTRRTPPRDHGDSWTRADLHNHGYLWPRTPRDSSSSGI
jgi:integrase